MYEYRTELVPAAPGPDGHDKLLNAWAADGWRVIHLSLTQASEGSALDPTRRQRVALLVVLERHTADGVSIMPPLRDCGIKAEGPYR